MSVIKSIPTIDLSAPEWLRDVLKAIKQTIEVRENVVPNGDIRNKHVTMQDLIDLKLITKEDLPND